MNEEQLLGIGSRPIYVNKYIRYTIKHGCDHEIFDVVSGIIVRMDTRLEDFTVKLSIDALRMENGRQKFPQFV